MEILVCIKQVPGTADVEVDSVTGVLKRDGVESKLNPYDLFALEMGFELAEKENARVTVITMGPMQAMEVLKEAVLRQLAPVFAEGILLYTYHAADDLLCGDIGGSANSKNKHQSTTACTLIQEKKRT